MIGPRDASLSSAALRALARVLDPLLKNGEQAVAVASVQDMYDELAGEDVMLNSIAAFSTFLGRLNLRREKLSYDGKTVSTLLLDGEAERFVIEQLAVDDAGGADDPDDPDDDMEPTEHVPGFPGREWVSNVSRRLRCRGAVLALRSVLEGVVSEQWPGDHVPVAEIGLRYDRAAPPALRGGSAHVVGPLLSAVGLQRSKVYRGDLRLVCVPLDSIREYVGRAWVPEAGIAGTDEEQHEQRREAGTAPAPTPDEDLELRLMARGEVRQTGGWHRPMAPAAQEGHLAEVAAGAALVRCDTVRVLSAMAEGYDQMLDFAGRTEAAVRAELRDVLNRLDAGLDTKPDRLRALACAMALNGREVGAWRPR
ncbi:MAG: hypothetical protein AB7E32_16895 [Desulfovibrio sp.]